MNWPRISIVTPSFNQGRFIEETIQSVLNQEYPNLEYIIMDGGSTDETPQIISRYENRIAYWFSGRDRGQADAIGKGFERATGSILAYLNSDDIYLPGALHAVAKSFVESNDDVVYGNTYWIGTDGRRLGERRQTPFAANGYMYGGFDLQQPATFWTRSIYEKAGGVDAAYSFAMDTDLFMRFVQQGARFRHIRQFVASFRIHPSSKSSTEIARCESELGKLRSRYLRYPFHSFAAQCARNYARAKRTLWYVLQGDLVWLLRRIPDRIRSRNSEEIVGPRSKWI